MKTFTLLFFAAALMFSCKENEIPKPEIETREVNFQRIIDHCNIISNIQDGIMDTLYNVGNSVDVTYIDTVGDRLYVHTWNDTTTIISFYVDGELYATDTADIYGETLIDTILH